MPLVFGGRATRNFLALLVLMHFILFVDRVNLAAAAPVIQQDLGLSNIALGLAFRRSTTLMRRFSSSAAGLPTVSVPGALWPFAG